MNHKIISVISVLAIIGGYLALSQNTDPVSLDLDPQPCNEPLTYRFADIDSRYNITKKQLSNIMKEVEDLWATALDADLLDFRQDGEVAIHLVYSEDQKRTEVERTFAKRIEVKQQEIKTEQREYEQSKQRYQKKKEDFQSTMDEYNRAVELYNDFAQEWSGKPLTSQAEQEFKQMEQNIDRLESAVSRKQKTLESLRRQTNNKSRKLNQLIEQQNQMAEEYNSKFSNPQKFDQGRYIKQGNSERINIYQFANQAQLKTVLAHEVGHAMGLEHVDNPESIMHEMMEKQNIFNLQLTDEDIKAIKNRCGS